MDSSVRELINTENSNVVTGLSQAISHLEGFILFLFIVLIIFVHLIIPIFIEMISF